MSFSSQRDTFPIAIPAEIGLAILQIIREAITNVIKHARANTVDILIMEDQGILIVEVQDDGKGMSKKSENKGIGLKSIEERMVAIGSKLRIKDDKPRGFVLTESIPLPLKSDLNTRLNSGVAYETF
jgi:signal transduction histidine kinase